jgi:phenylpyruvate tautomerase PptA (4-oxalocrotonate tautomerase family)
MRVKTNQEMATSEAETAFLQEASTKVAELLNKPERYCMVALEPGELMFFAGADTPCAHVELASLELPEEETQEYSQALCDFLQAKLEVEPERIYIRFEDVERGMWGTNRTTFG